MSEAGPSRGWLGPGPASQSAGRRDLGILSQRRGGRQEWIRKRGDGGAAGRCESPRRVSRLKGKGRGRWSLSGDGVGEDLKKIDSGWVLQRTEMEFDVVLSVSRNLDDI